jgi:GNAT superfamily N-acetyltransferase
MADDLDLRLGVASDEEAIRALTRAAYAKWVLVIGREPKPMTADYAKALRENRFDLLFIDGMLAALVETIAEDDCLLIENLAVGPAWQGRGFGRRLMAQAERVAAELGFSKTRLYTNAMFIENVEYYEGLGYRIDSEEAFSDGFVTHMSKPVGG